MMAGFDLPARAIRAQIASGINIVAHLERLRDGTRKLTRISEVTGMEDDVIQMQDVFAFNAEGTDPYGRVTGAFVLSHIRPRILERFHDLGLAMPPVLARLFPSPM
jgi:pilus assembly protein CpaF